MLLVVTPALYVGATIVAVGAAAALFIPRSRKAEAVVELPAVDVKRLVVELDVAAGRFCLSLGPVLQSACKPTARRERSRRITDGMTTLVTVLENHRGA